MASSLDDFSHSLWKMRAWIMPNSRRMGGGGFPMMAVVTVQPRVNQARKTYSQNQGMGVV